MCWMCSVRGQRGQSHHSPVGKGDSVTLLPWDTGLKTSLCAVCCTTKLGAVTACTFVSLPQGKIGKMQQICLIFTKNSLYLFISYCPLSALPLLTNESSHNLIKQELLLLCFTSR